MLLKRLFVNDVSFLSLRLRLNLCTRGSVSKLSFPGARNADRFLSLRIWLWAKCTKWKSLWKINELQLCQGVYKLTQISAVIPAAGYSSRMSLFKPLLPTDSSLVIERAFRTFQQAGIEDIRVVVGYKADLLTPVLARSGVKTIMNPNYDQGMYTSVQAGVRSLGKDIGAFFLLPADYAFVSAETIRSLWKAYERNSFEVIYPVYREERGHPPLISTKLQDIILRTEPEGGLKTLLETQAHNCAEIQVDDEGILIDLDSEEDYRKAIGRTLPYFPTRQECLKIVPERVLDHVQVVAGVACRIAEYLNSSGYRLHLGMVVAASLLHDVAKGEKGHARKGSEMIARLGYTEVADIVASHIELQLKQENQINETTIVFLADKLVSGQEVVSLDERLTERLNQFSEEAARQSARKRMGQAMAIQEQIERVLGLKLADTIVQPSRKTTERAG